MMKRIAMLMVIVVQASLGSLIIDAQESPPGAAPPAAGRPPSPASAVIISDNTPVKVQPIVEENPDVLIEEANRARENAVQLHGEGRFLQWEIAEFLLGRAKSLELEANLRRQADEKLKFAQLQARSAGTEVATGFIADAQLLLAKAKQVAADRHAVEESRNQQLRIRGNIERLSAKAAMLRKAKRYDEAAQADDEIRQLLNDLISPAASQTRDSVVQATERSKLQRERENHARQLAVDYLTTQSGDANEKRLADLKQQLRGEVTAAFEARQREQRAELDRLRGRLERIEKLVADRERIRDKIIEHRVAELLNPALAWEPARGAHGSTPDTTTAEIGRADAGDDELEDAVEAPQPTQDPSLAIVWIEATIEEGEPDGRRQLRAVYMNGTVISPDGLIAVVLGPDRIKRVKHLSVLLHDRREVSGKLVAQQDDIGVGLIKVHATGLPFLALANRPAVADQSLVLSTITADSTSGQRNYWVGKVHVTETNYTLDNVEAAGVFAFRSQDPFDPVVAGGPLVSTGGRVQGILGLHPPGKQRASNQKFWAVSSQVISRLIKESQGSQPGSHRRGAAADSSAQPGRASAAVAEINDKPAPPKPTTSPSDALAWIEATVEETDENDRRQLRANYMHGTVVSPDGLIAVVLEVQDQKQLKHATIMLDGGRKVDGKLVAYNAEFSAGLFKVDAAGLPFLALADRPVAAMQRLVIRGMGIHGNRRNDIWSGESYVDQTSFRVGKNDGFFTFIDLSRQINSRERSGAPMISTDGRVQGIMGGRLPSPPGEGGGHKPSQWYDGKCWAVPSQVILRLVQESQASQTGLNHNGAANGRPQPPPADSSRGAQVLIRHPQGAILLYDTEGLEGELVLPGRLTIPPGKTSQMKLRKIPKMAGIELSMTLEVRPSLPRTQSYVRHNAIPVDLTEEDIDQTANGNLITKVVYLPDPEFAEAVGNSSVETLVSFRLDPSVDPVAEADRRGAVLAILRIGNRE